MTDAMWSWVVRRSRTESARAGIAASPAAGSLTVRGLHAGYGAMQVVRGVDLDVERALQKSDRCYVLEAGGIALEGPSAELARDPRVAAIVSGAGDS
jgi:ABC-type branched-subunit amino acid transport system ATPase component